MSIKGETSSNASYAEERESLVEASYAEERERLVEASYAEEMQTHNHQKIPGMEGSGGDGECRGPEGGI